MPRASLAYFFNGVTLPTGDGGFDGQVFDIEKSYKNI
jgi:hypothetical protein